MTILVTGITGFLGREIAEALVADGRAIIGLSRSLPAEADRLDGVRYVTADITDRQAMLGHPDIGPLDAVVHTAGLAHKFANVADEVYFRVNTEGSANAAALAADRGAKRFILLSSTNVYGFATGTITEETACDPPNAYAKSKLDGEAAALRETGEGIITTIFRLPPVLGEKGAGNVPRLIGAIDRGRFFWVGSGENKKSLIASRDVAAACKHVLELDAPRGQGVFNLAGEPVTMKQIVAVIEEALGRHVPRTHIPAWPARWAFGVNDATLRLGAVARISQTFERWLSDDIYSAERLKREIGFTPATPMADAIRDQCRWYAASKERS